MLGYDKIFVWVLKDSCESIVFVIFRLVNNLFNVVVFFKVWKIVEVIFVFKEGNLEELVNNRLILLLFILLKVSERLVYK